MWKNILEAFSEKIFQLSIEKYQLTQAKYSKFSSSKSISVSLAKILSQMGINCAPFVGRRVKLLHASTMAFFIWLVKASVWKTPFMNIEKLHKDNQEVLHKIYNTVQKIILS